jgi:hypothetical protein
MVAKPFLFPTEITSLVSCCCYSRHERILSTDNGVFGKWKIEVTFMMIVEILKYSEKTFDLCLAVTISNPNKLVWN